VAARSLFCKEKSPIAIALVCVLTNEGKLFAITIYVDANIANYGGKIEFAFTQKRLQTTAYTYGGKRKEKIFTVLGFGNNLFRK